MQCLKTITFLCALCILMIGLVESSTLCTYKPSNNANVLNPKQNPTGLHDQDQDDTAGIIYPNHTIKCKGGEMCFSMWYPTNDSKKIVMQGCWDKPRDICSEMICQENVDPGQARGSDPSKFCCCSGDYCNNDMVEIEYVAVNTTEGLIGKSDTTSLTDSNYSQNTIIYAITPILFVTIVIVISYLIYRLFIRKYKEPVDPPEISEAPSLPSFELDQLKLCNFIERGRYGEVWKGLLNEHDVAVKIFTTSQRRYFINEKDIYTLPYMEHPNLCKFYGTEERIGSDGNGQYLLVISYVESGTLTSYLKNNQLTWSTLCRMSQSVTAGLAHLHTELNISGKIKPSIAHRDFNTRNIMVNPDQTCVVCDLGFAMKIARTRLEEEGEMTSLTDVGTLRYMSPEVLDGAVNLRDCEASLKQIDVYALGLVLWEMASRCTDLYQGMTLPDYQLPFQQECGVHPSFEEMQLLVSRNKARPSFPDVWKDTNQAVRALKETIEDCWDQDAEARLTARCVEERLLEMAALWEARHKGVTPTINTMGTGEFGGGSHQLTALISSHLPPQSSAHGSQLATEDSNGNVPLTQIRNTSGQEQSTSSRHHLSGDYSDFSTTTETTLTSPSEPDPAHHQQVAMATAHASTKDNVNMNYARNNKVLQPHQGQNPIVERNTHKHSDEELAIIGNTLVDKSMIGTAEQRGPSTTSNRGYIGHGGTGNRAYTDDLYDAIADNIETSLVQNDLLNQQRTTPIPYVQNQVHASNGALPQSSVSVVRPKQPNIPGNGSSHLNVKSNKPSNKSTKSKKAKDKVSMWQNLFGWGSLSKSNQNIENVETGETAGAETHAMATVMRPLLQQSNPQNEQANQSAEAAAKSNLDPHHPAMDTEVRIVNGSPIVRPTTLPVAGHDDSEDQPSPLEAARENRLGFAEVGVAKLQSACNGRPALVKMRRKSHSNGDLSPNLSVPPSNILSGVTQRASLSTSRLNTDEKVANSHNTFSDSNQNVLNASTNENECNVTSSLLPQPTSRPDQSKRLSLLHRNQPISAKLSRDAPVDDSPPGSLNRAKKHMPLLQQECAYNEHALAKSWDDVALHNSTDVGNGNNPGSVVGDISLQQFGGSVESGMNAATAAHCHC